MDYLYNSLCEFVNIELEVNGKCSANFKYLITFISRLIFYFIWLQGFYSVQSINPGNH